MNVENDAKRGVYAPMVPYFIAVVAGILIDDWTNPDARFWIFLGGVAVGATVLEFIVSLKKTQKTKDAENADYFENAGDSVSEKDENCASFGDSVSENVADPVSANAENCEDVASVVEKSVFGRRWLTENADDATTENADDSSWNAELRRFLKKEREKPQEIFAAAFSETFEVENDAETKAKIGETGAANCRNDSDFDADGCFHAAKFDFRNTDSSALQKNRLQIVFDCLNVWFRRVFSRFGVRRAFFWRSAFALTAVASLAGFRHYTYYNVYPEREIGFFIPENGTATTLEARLLSVPILYRQEKAINPLFQNFERTTFVVQTLRVKNGEIWEEYSGRVAVSIDGDASNLRIGDLIRVSGRLSVPLKPGNPGERDRCYLLRSQRILAALSVNRIENIDFLSQNDFSWKIRIARFFELIRLQAAQTLKKELSPQNAAVACGMTLGFRNDIDEETNNMFLKTGTVHLLSISGLHIALVAGAFYLFLSVFSFPPRLTTLITMIFVFFYVGLTDMRTPVLRAAALIAILSFGVLLRRRSISLNSLATTAVALLFWNPCELFSLGAQLSFLATGVFLWSSRTNLLDRAETAETRRAAIRERRQIFSLFLSKKKRTQISESESSAEPSQLELQRRSNQLSTDVDSSDVDSTDVDSSDVDSSDIDSSDVDSNDVDSSDVDSSDVDSNENDSSENKSNENQPERWISRARRSVRSAARRLGRSSVGKIWALTKTGAVIWAVGTPLILCSTNLFTPIAILANPLIWAPATFALTSALVLAVFGFIETAFSPVVGALFVAVLGPATDFAFDLFLGTLDFFRRPSFGAFRFPTLPVSTLWAFYSPLIFWTLFPQFRPSRKTATRALACWLAFVLVVDVAETRNVERRDLLRVDVLSVGHGVAILAFFPDGRTALVDCGSVSSSQKASELVAKSLWNAGKTRLDLVLLSHADYDHYGGIETLDESIEIGRVCVSPAMFQKKNDELTALKDFLERRKIPIETVVGGETLAKFGFSELSILHPTLDVAGTTSSESNENSLVVALERRGRTLMFPGDLDAPDAEFLRTNPTRFDLILAPHHGGKSENYRGLLDWANPAWIVVSGGSFQRNIETENALRNEGKRVLHTLDDGCVRIEIERDSNASENALGKMRIRTFRSERVFESGDF